jgi:hypothetical protein
MSEYQYYEFRAIDKPLTEAQKAKVSALFLPDGVCNPVRNV